jgi:hypothetical protein
VQIDKETVVSFLRERGNNDQAEAASRELPEQVDTERDAGMLERFGILPDELLGQITGGRDIPGL